MALIIGGFIFSVCCLSFFINQGKGRFLFDNPLYGNFLKLYTKAIKKKSENGPASAAA